MKKILLITITALCISYAIAQPTTGLVAYWPMNGNFNDAGPNALNGTNNGATAAANKNGQANSAMSFSNPSPSATTVNQFVLLPASSLLNFSGTQNFSIVFWMYISSPLLHANGMYENNLNTAGIGVWMWNSGGLKIQFNYKNGSIGTPVGAFTTDGWYNVACIRNNGTLSTYINGVLSVSGPEGTTAPTYPIQARFGTMSSTTFPPSNNYNGLTGMLDEMRVYNRALTLAEIQQIYALLPVKLTSFTATKNNTDVVLSWQTEYEQNSSHFNIQRSTDGINFTNISTTPAKSNSSLPSNYQFTDNTAKDLANVKTVFYRLQMVDIDASKVNSGTVAVKLDTDKRELTILQNPAGNDLRMQFSSSAKEIAHIIITDNSGRQLLTKQIQLNIGTVSTVIPVNALAAGNYYITVTSTQGKQTKAFLKQ
jgi:Concanavalin A-like lectin/glucanases superfamily